MTSKRWTSALIACACSWLSSHRPSLPGRASRTARRSSHSASGTMTSPLSGSGGNVPCSSGLSRCQLSAAMRRSLMRLAIDVLFKRIDSDAVHDIDEALGVAVAMLEIAADQALDDLRHLCARERGAERAPQCRPHPRTDLALISADLDLVPLVAVLIDAENADMADVVL